MDLRFVVVEDEGGRTHACMYARTHARTHQCAGEEVGCQAPPSSALCLITLRWTLSLTLALASFLARLAVSKFQRPPVCPLLSWACGYTCLYFIVFYFGAGDPSSGPHACKAGALPH